MTLPGAVAESRVRRDEKLFGRRGGHCTICFRELQMQLCRLQSARATHFKGEYYITSGKKQIVNAETVDTLVAALANSAKAEPSAILTYRILFFWGSTYYISGFTPAPLEVYRCSSPLVLLILYPTPVAQKIGQI